MSLSDTEILDAIYNIQQEWWDGDVEMNVALSEIRSMFRLRGYQKVMEIPPGGPSVSGGFFFPDDDYDYDVGSLNPICGIPDCRDDHPDSEEDYD